MHVPKCLTFDDVLDVLARGHYRAAGIITIGLVRNKLSVLVAFVMFEPWSGSHVIQGVFRSHR